MSEDTTKKPSPFRTQAAFDQWLPRVCRECDTKVTITEQVEVVDDEATWQLVVQCLCARCPQTVDPLLTEPDQPQHDHVRCRLAIGYLRAVRKEAERKQQHEQMVRDQARLMEQSLAQRAPQIQYDQATGRLSMTDAQGKTVKVDALDRMNHSLSREQALELIVTKQQQIEMQKDLVNNQQHAQKMRDWFNKNNPFKS